MQIFFHLCFLSLNNVAHATVIPHLTVSISKVRRTSCELTVFHWEFSTFIHLDFLLPTERIKDGEHKNITVLFIWP